MANSPNLMIADDHEYADDWVRDVVPVTTVCMNMYMYMSGWVDMGGEKSCNFNDF